MTKRFNKFILLALALVMVLGMALPSFAANKAVKIDIYKDGKRAQGIHSMAQKAVKGGYIVEENGATYLVVETKFFRHMFMWGTMQNMKYTGDNGQIIQALYDNFPSNHGDGELKIKLEQSIVNDLNAGKEVEFKDGQVKSTVLILGHELGDFKPVDFVIKLK